MAARQPSARRLGDGVPGVSIGTKKPLKAVGCCGGGEGLGFDRQRVTEQFIKLLVIQPQDTGQL